MANIEDRVEKCIKSKIESLGFELYDVEYAKEGKDYFLRIYIDSKNGINIEDCEKVSNAINEPLDEENIIREQYFLEVSSPGVERVLRKEEHLKNNIGKEIEVKLFKKDNDGNKVYKGILESFDEQIINLESKKGIERKNISQIKTIYNW